MLNLKALTVAVVLGVLPPVNLIHVLNESQVLAQTQKEQKAEADRLFQQGLKQLNQGQSRKALQSFQQAIKIYGQISHIGGLMAASFAMGSAYLELGESEKAIEIYEKLLEFAEEINEEINNPELVNLIQQGLQLARKQLISSQYQNSSQKAKANQLLTQGVQQSNNSQYQAALQSLQEALRIYREIGDRLGEAASLSFLGIAYRHLEQYQKAIEFYQQALVIAKEIGDRYIEASLLQDLGFAYSNLEQYQQAIEFYQQSLSIAQEINNSELEQAAQKGLHLTQQLEVAQLIDKGRNQFEVGQFQAAIQSFQEALTISQSIGYSEGEAISLDDLGVVYYSLGQYQEAIEFHQQSLYIDKKDGSLKREAVSLGNLGIVYRSLGQYQKAIEFYQQSLAIEQEIGNRKGEAASLGNLGVVYYSLGQYQKSIEFYQQSLAIEQEIGNREGEANALGSLGNTHIRIGQYNKAIEFLEKSFAIFEDIKSSQGVATALGGLGDAYNGLGQYEKAIDLYQQSLAIAREIGDRNLEVSTANSLGGAYFKLGQFQKSREFYNQSLTIAKEIKNPQGEINGLLGLGIVSFALGQPQQAIKFHSQSLAIAIKIRDRHGESIVLNNLGIAYFVLGEFSAAQEHFSSGIDVLEALRKDSGNDTNKISIFDTQINTYKGLQIVLIAQNQTHKSLEIAERSRAKALVDLMTARLSDNPEDSEVNSLSIQQIQQIAKNKQATLVLYSVLDFSNEIFTWVIKPTGEVEFKRQDYEFDLNELVEVARDSIGVRDRGVIKLVPISESDEIQQREKLQQLHQLLIEPIADFLPKNPDEPVIFMPQGALFLVPFPALQDAEGNYLVDQHTILTAPSIQTLELTGQQRQRVSGEGVLIVGNPTMPSVPKEIGEEPVQLTPLEGAETEAKEIAKFFNTDAMIGSEATKSAVLQKISNARVVHLATHGLLDDFGLGVPGAIALAPDPNFKPEIGEFNGLLTAGEIFDLDLSAELVVLSACNTGRGQIRGEGVIGLSRSLIQAGVPSVLVSLWQVPDAPTAELMVEFYRNLEEKNLDKAQALRQAMLTIKEKHPNPRNWAAFTLIGEAD